MALDDSGTPGNARGHCPACGGPPDAAGACRNCGTPFAPPAPPGPPELPADADPDAAQEGVRQLIRLMGEDPGREGLEETPERAVAALCGLTRGYDRDPATILAGSPPAPPGGALRVETLASAVVCERCLTPARVVWTLAAASAAGGPLPRAERLREAGAAIASRLHELPGGLAEQLAAAAVDLGGAAAAGALVTVMIPCAGCEGAGELDSAVAVRGPLHEWPAAMAALGLGAGDRGGGA